MKAEELLILDRGGFSQQASELFKRLNRSASFREWLVRDPAGAIASVLFSGQQRIPAARINQGNRVLLALLSNQNFLAWSREFQGRIQKEVEQVGKGEDAAEAARMVAATIDRSRLYREIIEASLKFMDQETLYGLLVVDPDEAASGFVDRAVAGVNPALAADVAVDIETFIYAVVAVAVFLVLTQIDINPIVAPEGLSRQDLQRVSGFVADRLTQRAQELRGSGALTTFEVVKRGPGL
jgi:hypothetical protein